MNSKAKLPVILLTLLLVISLALAGYGFYMLQQEKGKNAQLQEQLNDIKTTQRVTEKKLSESLATATALEMKLGEAKAEATNLKNDLEVEKTAKQENAAKMEQLKIDLEQQKQLRADLEKKYADAQKDTDKIQTQLKEITTKKDELEAKVKELQSQSSGVELGKIVVSPDMAGQPEGVAKAVAATTVTTEGKVLVVNNEHDFIVFSLGSKNGVKIGDMYSVLRNNKNIGEVKVEKVQDNMSAAGFVNSAMKGKVNEGDKVILKTK